MEEVDWKEHKTLRRVVRVPSEAELDQLAGRHAERAAEPRGFLGLGGVDVFPDTVTEVPGGVLVPIPTKGFARKPFIRILGYLTSIASWPRALFIGTLGFITSIVGVVTFFFLGLDGSIAVAAAGYALMALGVAAMSFALLESVRHGQAS